MKSQKLKRLNTGWRGRQIDQCLEGNRRGVKDTDTRSYKASSKTIKQSITTKSNGTTLKAVKTKYNDRHTK